MAKLVANPPLLVQSQGSLSGELPLFFFFYPTGITYRPRNRGLVCHVIWIVILYRWIFSWFFPPLRTRILQFFPIGRLDWELGAAGLQSLFTPLIIPNVDWFQQQAIVFASFSIIAFWIIFGAALEDRLTRAGLVFFYLLGGLLGVAVCAAPICGVTELFWLGHASTMFCMGACYALFAFDDMRIHYSFMSFFFRSHAGVWLVPTVFGLVPFHLLLIGAQSYFWYNPKLIGTLGFAVRIADISPLAWGLLVPILGGLSALVWRKLPIHHEAPEPVLA